MHATFGISRRSTVVLTFFPGTEPFMRHPRLFPSLSLSLDEEEKVCYYYNKCTRFKEFTQKDPSHDDGSQSLRRYQIVLGNRHVIYHCIFRWKYSRFFVIVTRPKTLFSVWKESKS